MKIHGTYIYICIGHNFVLEYKLLRTLAATLQQERISPLLEVLFSCFTVLSAWSNIHCNHHWSSHCMAESLKLILKISAIYISACYLRAQYIIFKTNVKSGTIPNWVESKNFKGCGWFSTKFWSFEGKRKVPEHVANLAKGESDLLIIAI